MKIERLAGYNLITIVFRTMETVVYKAVIMQGHILSHFTVFFNRSRFTTTVLQIVFTLSNNLGQKKTMQ